MDDRLLSVDDVAAYLGVMRDTVYKWIVRHGLPARKVGRLWKFRRSEVDQWFNEQPVRRNERDTRAGRRRTGR